MANRPRLPAAVFEALVRGVEEQRWDDLADLYAEDAIVEHPLAAPGSAVPRLLRGRGQLREHFRAAGSSGLRMRAERIAIHRSTDPEVLIAEFEYVGLGASDAERFVVPCVFVLRVRDGQIVESRDYVGTPRASDP